MQQRPNVLVIVSHDTGTCITPYGIDTVHTPTCERLAREGIRFARSFCTAPQCSPARASLFTGRYPHSNGVLGLANDPDHWRLHADERHLARCFGRAGYHTARIGITHETTRSSQAELLDCAIDLPQATSIHAAPTALAQVIDSSPAGTPWYAQVGCFETHRDFLRNGVEPEDSLGVHIPPPIPDTDDSRADYAAFQGAIRSFDRGLAAVLALLEDRGVLDGTIVVVTTDHGPAMPWAKGGCSDRGLGTFCLMRHPDWGAGRVCEHLFSGVDLLPTLLSACAIPLPSKPLHGVDFLPWLEAADTSAPRDHIWGEKTFHDCYDPMRCVRETRFKYIRYFEHSAMHRVTGDSMAGGAYRACGGAAFKPRPREELFDCEFDPHEQHDLADDPAHTETRQRLRARMLAIMEGTGDPLLHGPIASPVYTQAIDALRTAGG